MMTEKKWLYNLFESFEREIFSVVQISELFSDSPEALQVELGEESLRKQLPPPSSFQLPYPNRLYRRVIPEPR